MSVSMILGLSVLLQFAAAFFALRLIRVTGRRSAWILLSAAILLMALRRAVSFAQIVSEPGAAQHIHWTPELLALMISVLMVAGIAAIGPIFEWHRQSMNLIGESEERYRTLFDSTPDMILVTDVEAGTIVDCNRAAMNLLGREKSELTGQSQAILHPLFGDEGSYRQTFRDHLEGREGQLIEAQVIDGRGTIRDVAIQANSLQFQGRKLIQVIFRDITERKEAELALKKSEEQYRLVFENAPLGIMHFDKDGTITDLNVKFAEIIGAPKEAIIGFNMPGQLKDDKMLEAINTSLEGKFGYFEGDYTSVTGDKTTPVRAFFQRMVSDSGDFLGGVSIFEDNTERGSAEKALRESEERYRMIFDGSRDAIFIAGTDARFVDVNQAASVLTGYSTDELKAMSIPDLHERVDLHAFEIYFDRIMAEESITSEAKILRKDRTKVDTEFSNQSIIIAGRRLMHTVARDITKRKQAEEALRESEEKYKALVETTGTGYVIIDTEGRVLDANHEYIRLTGHDTLQEIIGRRITEWTADHDIARNSKEIKKCLEQGFVRNLEMDYLGKEAQIVPIEINATVLGTGDAQRVVTLCRDITARRHTEEALKASEENFRRITESMRDLVCQADVQGNYQYVSPSYRIILGYEPQDLAGESIFARIHPHDLEGVMARYHKGLTTRLPQEAEFRYKHADGHYLWFRSAGNLFFDAGGQPMGIVIGSHDITERKRVELALQESEQRFRMIFDSVNDAILVYDVTSGKILNVNQGMCEMYGYTREEAQRISVEDLSSGDAPYTREDALAWMKRAAAGEPQLFDWRAKHKSGRLFWVEVNMRLAKLSDEDQLLVVMRDITERKQTEESLRESVLRQTAILNNIPDIAWLKDHESRFIAVNEPFGKACGVASEELVGKSDLDIWPKDLAELYRNDDREVMQTRKHKRIEERLLDGEGNERWIETIKTPIISDDGEVLGTTGIARDITERKSVQDALQASEQSYRTTIDSLSDLIHVTDPDLRILLLNSAFLKRNEELGLDTQVIGHNLFHVFPFLPKKVRDEYQWVFDNKKMLITEESVEVGEKQFITETRKIPIIEGAQVARVVTFIRDVTEKRIAEHERELLIAKLEAQNFELERFTYTVSHDLRSPLVTIRGFLGFLEKDAINGNIDGIRADTQRIREATDKMERLLKDLLDLSRIGRMVNPFEEIPFGELANEAARLVSGQIAESGVQVSIAPNLPTVYGDRPRLVEVLQNLIENAVKFMGNQPRPQVEIGATRDGEKPVYYVRDNGIGIDPMYHEKIFGLFERLDGAVEGTGVGLALVRRIVELHGGRIWVESKGIGDGSSFCFTLATRPQNTSPE